MTGLPVLAKEKIDGSSKAQDQQSQDPQPPGRELASRPSSAQCLSAVRNVKVAARGLPQLWLVQGSSRRRGQLN